MSTTEIQDVNPRLEALHERMAASSLGGHWQAPQQQKPDLKPWVWPWSEIYACLEESGEVMSLGEAGSANDRRTVNLVNPAMTATKRTSLTLQMSVQLVKPGETAACHRHTFNAMRFVVQSGGMYTTADGEQQIMEPGDLLIQPGWAWHDHTNDTNEPGVWLDLLDSPLASYFDVMLSEQYGEGRVQPITKPEGYSRQRFGSVRPPSANTPNMAVAYSYKWTDTLRVLEELAAAGEGDPYDGVLLEYTNPLTGGPTLPTFGAAVQMLRPGEETRPHRHMGSTVYHTVRGQGVTTVGKGQTEDLEWGERDCFFMPSWRWHQHRNRSKSEPAILFSITDRPAVQALGFYREEKG